MLADDFLTLLEGVQPNASGWSAICPSHNDRHPSLSIGTGEDGRILVKCHAGCSPEQITQALGLNLSDLFPGVAEEGGGHRSAPDQVATLQPQQGCTLAQYAAAKCLPAEFLSQLGLSDFPYLRKPAVRIPYRDASGTETAVRFRLALEGEPRFRWKKGCQPCLYGLPRLAAALSAGYVVLVEGESDCHTLWLHEIPALGIPGASSWREEWAKNLDGFQTIYVVIEPDRGGETLRRSLASSSLRERIRFIDLGEFKDASGLHLSDPGQFRERWRVAVSNSVSWVDYARRETEARTREAWAQCASIAADPSILDRFSQSLTHTGVVGESRAAKLIYLALTSRLLERPVSCAIKGPSSGGKSFITGHVLNFFPPSAYYELSAMSERLLAFSEEPLAHRFLVIFEAVALQGEIASYLLRSLLSEGKLRYATTEKTEEGFKARLLERKGPTGLLVTTTAISLHPENETRLFSIPISDASEQTAGILEKVGRDDGPSTLDLRPWHALQEWLEGTVRQVSIVRFGKPLARMIPPVGVRLRRDFPALVSLIKAHALLHQANRDRGSKGEIFANFDDYAAVRELTADLIGAGLEATVPDTVRETVAAVEALQPPSSSEFSDNGGVTVTQVARKLELDKSSTSRRIKLALKLGYLKNLETHKWRPARVVPADSLPGDHHLLPSVEELRQGCKVAVEMPDNDHPPSQSEVRTDTNGEPQSLVESIWDL